MSDAPSLDRHPDDPVGDDIPPRLPHKGRQPRDPEATTKTRRIGSATPGRTLGRWKEFREAQRTALRESNSRDARMREIEAKLGQHGQDLLRDSTGREIPRSGSTAYQHVPETDFARPEHVAAYRASPFTLGFVATIGGLLAYMLYTHLSQLGTTFSIIMTSLFLTLALNPGVELLVRKGLKRGLAVAVVGLGFFVSLGLILWLVVPPLVQQTTALIDNSPDYFRQLRTRDWWQRWDHEYHLGDKIQATIDEKVSDGSFAERVFGGILGASMMVLGTVFLLFTVLMLTFYMLGSLPSIKRALYNAVPASRRPRFIVLSEEIMRRVGLYAAGQVLVAFLNGLASFFVLWLTGMPYPAVLAVCVGILGLIPMVGAELGGVLVVTVGLFQSVTMAVIMFTYYMAYQQFENYFIFPTVMKRTVNVPGAVTVVAALAGGTMLGFVGALMAVPIAAALILLYEEILVPRQATR